ncbi:MAG: NADH:ubiquinone oxidoreductase [Pseudomonas sp.]|nr:NADH:ubiquinone oxidoreductase [Pseudomonas sp.]MDD2223368.1 NADH:ubiquinone oxidoreductase [Pseudomonas sp.]MDY0414816.1 NADH:ubiquinone oxidoreductase [Pseudomonas sp.]NLO53509.1 NADH:ubiquinone oxidoreductase [Gammaproteobacteria bacterium]
MRLCSTVLLLLLSPSIFAQACVIESVDQQVKVKICQYNRSIPEHLFKSGFCQPQLQGQTTSVSFVEQCPSGAFGVCRNAQAGGLGYVEDIYYYGVKSDARYLKPACEQQSKGQWITDP